MTAACPEGCRFCPVTYWKGSISARYNPIEGLVPSAELTAPEQLVAELLADEHLHRLGGLGAVEQIALATTRFGKKPSLEHGMYEDYAIRLGRTAHRHGFRGRMFLLSDRIRSAEQMVNVRRQLVDQGVPAYVVYTFEMADDSRRRRVMPGDKGRWARRRSWPSWPPRSATSTTWARSTSSASTTWTPAWPCCASCRP